ncbi:hypothetical protein J5N97_029211 [Dioscorea zingiberensis]|uniref:MADS-box domain-containing protein n=1 Tax=Dioscorea zingiberensis TaxID=325984 RepID=A0A9D5C0Y3_9LILI|nr:hypothetical protein J5N97_029211 [Dioscorea zingiberensis]
MARRKVKLEWISKESTRKATFKKRKQGLLKKIRELSILCDVKAFAIIYGLNEAFPEIWSSTQEKMEVLLQFMGVPEFLRYKKMMNQETFLHQQVMKLQEQVHKYERENRELERMVLLGESLLGKNLHEIDLEAISSLSWMVDTKLKAVEEKVMKMKGGVGSNVVLVEEGNGEGEHGLVGGEGVGQEFYGGHNMKNNGPWFDGNYCPLD